MNFRFFLFVSLIVMLFAINCASSIDEETAQISNQGILQDTTVMIQKDELQYGTIPQDDRDSCYVKRIVSDACIERKVPLSIWSSMEEIMSNYSVGGLDGTSPKEHFCSINEFKFEPGVPFESGARVEIIGASENDCQRVVLMKPGSTPLKLPTSLIKIRVLDGKDKDLEGWTWTGAVKRD